MATPELTAVEVISSLVPIIGTGGVGAAIVAYFSYRKAVAEGRRGDPQHGAIGGITAVMADSESFTKVADGLADVGVALTKFTLVAGNVGDEVVRELHHLNEKVEGVIEEIRKHRRAIEDRPSARTAQQAAQTGQ